MRFNRNPFCKTACLPALALLVAVGTGADAHVRPPYMVSAITNDVDPHINARGVQINRLLKILKNAPKYVHATCMTDLQEMDGLQYELDHSEGLGGRGAVEVMRDELQDQMDEVVESCGEDALAVCKMIRQDIPDEDRPTAEIIALHKNKAVAGQCASFAARNE